MLAFYEVTPSSPVEGHHAGQGLEYTLYDKRLEELDFFFRLGKRRFRGDFIAAYSHLMEGHQKRQSLTLSKGAE